MLRKKVNGLTIYEFSLFDRLPLRHAIITRHGSASFPSKTTSIPNLVTINQKRIENALDCSSPVFLDQVHGTTIHIHPSSDKLLTGDGMITNQSHLPLAIRHADCQAAIFYDAKHHVLAAVHTGWRGLVKNIYAQCLKQMREAFKTHPGDLFVGVSPSLGPSASQFRHYRQEFPPALWKYKRGNDHIDLWELALDQLTDQGIPEKQIEIARLCTYQNPTDFFSYRKDQTTERNATIAYLY